MKTIFTSLKLLLLTLIFSQTVSSQAIGDYRTTALANPTGNWNNSAIWERWDGLAWITPATPPTSSDGLITIRSGHTVEVNVASTASAIVVETGANLNLQFIDGSPHPNNPLTISDGVAGDDLIVNGTLLLRGFRSLIGNTGATAVINNTMNWFAGTLQMSTTISASGTMNLNLDFVKDLKANVTNNGNFNWTALTTGMTFQDVTFTNNGTFTSTFSTNRGIGDLGGTNAFINNGTFRKTDGFSFVHNTIPFTNTGTLKGSGYFNLTSGITTNTGIIEPGASPGILSISPAAVTSQTPTIKIEILDGSGAGTGHDRLDFTGTTDLSGTTLIVTENTAAPWPVSYTIMTTTAGTFLGNFAAVVIPLGYSITYVPGGTTVIVNKLGPTLPAVWGDFNALAKNNNRVNLNWSTLQESNVSHYTVEYSANGRDYTSIGTVAATGNTTNVTNYSFVHSTPDVQKTNYYRIRQSDLDGKTAYSVIRPVRFSKGTVAPILVTPNPVRDRLQLSVQAENIRIMLVDLSGRTLKNMNLQPGNHELSVSELAPGMYHLVIFQDGLRLETQKLIKQ